MADKTVRIFDTKTQKYIPIRLVDNGDGTYSEAVKIEIDNGDGSLTIDDGDGSITIDDGNDSITVDGFVEISDTWHPSLQSDITENDSDKLFTVPASTEWEILNIWVEFSSTATVGNRQLEVQLQDSAGDIIGAFQVGLSQAASLLYYYLIGIGLPDLTALYDTNYLMSPLPAGLFLSAGEKIRIWDNNAIDAAADDMVVKMKIAYRTV
jgi:hypothetical protein